MTSAWPPEAFWLQWLLRLSHWPTQHSNLGVAVGCAAIVAAYVTRAVWTTAFLMLFGMDPKFGAVIAFTFYACLCPMTIFCHCRFFSSPYVMDRLLRELDSEGKHLERIEAAAKRSVFCGFLYWGFSWCISWWLVFKPSAFMLGEARDDEFHNLVVLMWALLPIDFVFGRALEHKARLLQLYIHEVHTLVVSSIHDFAKGVENTLGSEVDGDGRMEVYEKLHQVECRMRSHVKWVNDSEGTALMAFMAQEGLSAVYTSAVALYTNQPWLELGLLMYSAKQLHGLFATGLDIAMPGDEYMSKVQNLDTPRTLMVLSQKFQHGGTCGAEYIEHLYRAPAGIKIWSTLIRTPIVIRACVTLAVPTIGVAFRSLVGLMDIH